MGIKERDERAFNDIFSFGWMDRTSIQSLNWLKGRWIRLPDPITSKRIPLAERSTSVTIVKKKFIFPLLCFIPAQANAILDLILIKKYFQSCRKAWILLNVFILLYLFRSAQMWSSFNEWISNCRVYFASFAISYVRSRCNKWFDFLSLGENRAYKIGSVIFWGPRIINYPKPGLWHSVN